ncbi:RNA polymerase sigma-70 factor [Streptomyces xantholiticus]|uniref:RNA polymerase sigma-70 factor n=1 Tax=Streptomyces xantholiticus TaxID=68285 RepID=UPI0016799A87|nr:RNA polymerase sigma-70 factor [Streptomyces xantholiticus]GGW66832.1 DNA-directed RNA polymerase sigma-70 factor [Streptomyces xantholiticus]
MDKAQQFEEHRPRLFSLAYRMLGSAAEAEDAVQDAYLRWHGAEPGQVSAPGPWLAKVLTNLCLNRLTSARMRRVEYMGPWLPEPVRTDDGTLGPMETAEQREAVSLAMLVLMERLTPPERATVVLRDAFRYSHRDIAGVIGCSEANARQLYRRAKQHLTGGREKLVSPRESSSGLLTRFLDAAAQGSMTQLEALLADDVVAWSDGGGKVSAARRPVVGREKVARFLAGLVARFAAGVRMEIVEANGSAVVLGREDGALTSLSALEAGEAGIIGIRIVRNPDKLAFLASQLREPSQNG